MAQVHIEDIIDHLSLEMRRALAAAVKEAVPEAEFSEWQLYRAFLREVRLKCSTWEQVPDKLVKKK
jgi:hypothetical protein